MTKLETAKQQLSESRAYLKNGKARAHRLLRDPAAAAWKEIGLKEHSVTMQMLGVKAVDIEQSLAAAAAAAKKIAKHITACDNEIGNQLADLLTKPNPDKALEAASRLDARCRELDPMLAELTRNTEVMTAATAALTASLDLKHLIPLARHLVSGRKSLFDSGLEVYALIARDRGEHNGGTGKGLHALCRDARQLTSRFQRTDIPKLPRIAEDIFFHYLDIGARTTTEVQTFLDNIEERVRAELDSVALLEGKLSNLAGRPLPELLEGVRALAMELKEIISAFHHRKQLKDNLDAAAEALEYLNVFHLALKNKIGAGLEQKVTEQGSPLNPVTAAAKNTKAFFVGAKGLIRSVKLMVHSLKGSGAVNEVELQLILETAINRCKTFYEKTPRDSRKMQEFINELVGRYPKPFPYQDLAAIIKETVTSYGAEVVLFIKHYRVKAEFQSMTDVPLPVTMGQLTKKIIGRNKTFKKANAAL